jgi:NAD-dependent dihydropyrimidine dehydrogenase PreA subunit
VNCLTIAPDFADDFDLRAVLSAPAVNPTQELYSSAPLPQTRRIMVKDEDVCLHCGLCAERCPTAAWDMRQFELVIPYAFGAGASGGVGRFRSGAVRAPTHALRREGAQHV